MNGERRWPEATARTLEEEDDERMPVTEQKTKKEMEELARYVKRFYERARASGLSRMDAEDAAQNAFMDACNRKEPYPTCPDAREAVLLTILDYRVRTYFTERRRQGRRGELAEEYTKLVKDLYTRDPSVALEAKEQLELIFPQIKPEQLEVFTTKVLDNLTIHEVAAHLGINANTARSRWERAIAKLELEVERLEKPNRRGVIGLVSIVWISGILATARNANAMVEWWKELLRVVGRLVGLPLRALPGIATAAAVMVSTPQTDASADAVNAQQEPASSVAAMGSAVQPPTNAPVAIAEFARIPSLPTSTSRRILIPRNAVTRAPSPKILAEEAPPPDHLLTMAILALQRGNPEKALAILEGYTPRNVFSGDTAAVEALRARANRAIAEKSLKKRD